MTADRHRSPALAAPRRVRAVARVLAACLALGTLLPPLPAEARGAREVYHAARRGVAGRIERQGLSMGKARASARFGKGAYFSLSRKGARLERPAADSVLKGRVSARAWARRWNTGRMSPSRLRALSGSSSMRGAMKHGVIGPKLGHRLAAAASREGRVLVYRPRGRPHAWGNVYVPPRVYRDGRAVPRLKAEGGHGAAGRAASRTGPAGGAHGAPRASRR